MMRDPAEPRHRFRRITAAGVLFQGGAAAVDTSTIVAALVHGLTGSTFAVGAAAAIARYGWLFPQIVVGYLAQERPRRMPFYLFGAFGRVACLAGVAALVASAGAQPGSDVIVTFFLLWTLYAFVSGIVAVSYNDIVARSIASERRSRMLAIRFFGGGLLALGVAAIAGRLLDSFAFPAGYGAVLFLGALLLLISTLSFVSAGEPEAPPSPEHGKGFGAYLRAGVEVLRSDLRFRLFLYGHELPRRCFRPPPASRTNCPRALPWIRSIPAALSAREARRTPAGSKRAAFRPSLQSAVQGRPQLHTTAEHLTHSPPRVAPRRVPGLPVRRDRKVCRYNRLHRRPALRWGLAPGQGRSVARPVLHSCVASES